MTYVTLGKTGIRSPKNAFGALPIQRVSAEYAAMLLRKAYDAGFTFFDTARAYTDSEEKIGAALSDVRDKITIATKTTAKDAKTFWEQLKTSLKNLRTGFVVTHAVVHAGRTHQLGYDHPLRAVDDKGSAFGHQREIAHKNVLLFHFAGLFV